MMGLEMNSSCEEIRGLLLHEFRLDHKATQTTNNTCSKMGEDVLSIRAAQHWLNRFQNGNLELDDLRHSLLWPEVAGLLRARNSLSTSALATSHR